MIFAFKKILQKVFVRSFVDSYIKIWDQCNLFPPPNAKWGEQVHKLFSCENELTHCHKRLLVILVINCIVFKH